MTTDSSVLTHVQAGVAWITLNRGPQRNALDIPTLKHLHTLLDAFNSDASVRAVVLTASGRSFCAGADLAEWADAEARGALETYGWTETAHALMTRLHTLDKPTIASINGTAVGAGMDLALCCDLRIASQSARFKAGYTSMAYSPDAGASWHLPRLIGSEQAKRLLFLDELWSADRALATGLVGEVVADQRNSGRSSSRAMIWRWISEVPSQIRSIRALRQMRSTGPSSIKPMPPKICTASSATLPRVSLANSLAIPASPSVMLPWSIFQAVCRVSSSAARICVAISASLKLTP